MEIARLVALVPNGFTSRIFDRASEINFLNSAFDVRTLSFFDTGVLAVQ